MPLPIHSLSCFAATEFVEGSNKLSKDPAANASVYVDELPGIVELIAAVDTVGPVDVFINGRADAGAIAPKETPEMKR